jgi:ribosomal protein S12
MDEILITQALDMMRNNPDLAADALQGAPVRNTVLGSIFAAEYKIPRWAAEHCVRVALSELHGIRERRGSAR